MHLRSSASALLPLALLASVALAPDVRAQSAWTQPAGGVFVQLTLNEIGPYEKLYTQSGPAFRTGREIVEASLELYGEYGISEGWTLVGKLPLRYVSSGSVVTDATIEPVTIPEDSLTGLGNVLVGARRQILSGDIAVAAELDVELPTASSDATSGLRTGLDATTFRPLLSVGRGFGANYAQAYVGFSLRTDDYSNDWRVGAEFGRHFTQQLLVAATFDLVQSFEDGGVVAGAAQAQTGLFLDDQEYAAFGIKTLYEFTEGFGISAGVRGAFAANNVPQAGFLSFGIYFQR